MITYAKLSQKIHAINSGGIFEAKVKNSGSEDLRVDGSTTPVNFILEDLVAGSDLILQRITFVIGADETLDLSKFGNIDALANGVSFEINANNEEEKVTAIIKNNADTMLISTNVSQSTAGVGSNTITSLYGTWDFTEAYGSNGILVKNNDLKITIRDDLTGMIFFKVSAHGIIVKGS